MLLLFKQKLHFQARSRVLPSSSPLLLGQCAAPQNTLRFLTIASN
jgi:hypothetical protein